MNRRVLVVLCGWVMMGMSMSVSAIELLRTEDVLLVRGRIGTQDASAFRQALTADVHYLVLAEPQGNDWEVAVMLATWVERAALTTVVHGRCESVACAVLFLAGRQRMFESGARRAADSLHIPAVWSDSGNAFMPALAYWSARIAMPAGSMRSYLQHPRYAQGALLFEGAGTGRAVGRVLGCTTPGVCQGLPGLSPLGVGVLTTSLPFARRELISQLLASNGAASRQRLPVVPDGVGADSNCRPDVSVPGVPAARVNGGRVEARVCGCARKS